MRRWLACVLSLMIVLQSLYAIADGHVWHQDHGFSHNASSQAFADPAFDAIAAPDADIAQEEHHHFCQSHALALLSVGYAEAPLPCHPIPLYAITAPVTITESPFRPPIA
ncbi:MAG: hypothetical protein LAT61_12065 [Alcanivorax sp.]|nr:hypothetical protein [Alcanivorax sp.]